MERSPALEQPTPMQYALFKAIKMLPFNPLESTPALLKLIMEYDRVRTEQLESLQALALNFINLNPTPGFDIAGRKPKCPLCLR